MDLTSLLRRRTTGGSPVALPSLLDRCSERWWGLPPRLRAALLVVLVLLALAAVGRGAARSPWGAPTTVLVAGADLTPGDPVGTGALVEATRPAELIPHDALGSLEQLPTQARVRGVVPAGSVLTRRHVAGGIAGLLEPGETAVPVARDGHPPLQAGQLVDAVVTTPQGTGSTVATGARILATDDTWAWIAAPVDQVEVLAGAAGSGQLVLAVRGG